MVHHLLTTADSTGLRWACGSPWAHPNFLPPTYTSLEGAADTLYCRCSTTTKTPAVQIPARFSSGCRQDAGLSQAPHRPISRRIPHPEDLPGVRFRSCWMPSSRSIALAVATVHSVSGQEELCLVNSRTWSTTRGHQTAQARVWCNRTSRGTRQTTLRDARVLYGHVARRLRPRARDGCASSA